MAPSELMVAYSQTDRGAFLVGLFFRGGGGVGGGSINVGHHRCVCICVLLSEWCENVSGVRRAHILSSGSFFLSLGGYKGARGLLHP